MSCRFFWHCSHTFSSLITVFPLIEAGSQIQAGGQTSFVLIEAGSLTEAGGGLRANTIELIAHHPVALWCIASIVRRTA